ncbi:STAS domain-containing protein [bacterium]|nr:STAS domain-containing protein [bacterium]
MFQNENVTVTIQKDKCVSVFKIKGELDAFSTYDFNKFVEKIIPELNDTIIIDMKECKYISSSGISSLFNMCRICNNLDIRLTMSYPSKEIYSFFKTVNLHKLIDINNVMS